ncbi:MAG: response regulator [Methylothermaceae bacterium]|nr:response regulator [Methylothermaceae bacterium]
MEELGRQTILKERRDYNAWVTNETLEDYALRYAPKSFRKWSEFRVANTAFGSIAFLMLEAIGGFLTLNYGFTNACWAILAAGAIIFLTAFPVSYYAARYNIDMDLLTRGAGFGYIGSTFTSLIYASFTFTLFALEASIMSLALELYFGIPLAAAHVISAIIVIPLVTYGITNINRLQLWTQPLWLLLLVTPYVAILFRDPQAWTGLTEFSGMNGRESGFDWIQFGTGTTVALAMVAQVGEQVDFLRFLPEKNRRNRKRWWTAIVVAGPGWIFLGMARQFGGALLAYIAIGHGIAPEHAHEPTQMYLTAYRYVFHDLDWILAATILLVMVSQIKINVTNAYAGSLAWSNLFSRLTHCHPGRVVWLVFNVAIALLLMELGVFNALERVLGLFSNVAIAWIGVLAADLTINKPLGLSPPHAEFKRAHLPDLNPVGVISTLVASGLSVAAYLGVFGNPAQAFSALIALAAAFVLPPFIAYWARPQAFTASRQTVDAAGLDARCSICGNAFEPEDKAYCPAYQGTICSLCCTLEARCLDACKPGARLADQLMGIAGRWLPGRLSRHFKLRLVQFSLVYVILATLTGVFIGVIYFQDLLAAAPFPRVAGTLYGNFLKVYSALLVFLGLAAWWLVLNNESRRTAQEESGKQTRLLLKEIEEHRVTDRKLQQAMQAADRANQAKSRFLSDMSHEIRTPLNSILGYAQILRKDPSIPSHRRDAVNIMLRSGEHLATLIEDILDIARIEARKFELKPTPMDFPAFVEQLVRMFRPQAEAKGLAFRCQIVDPLPARVRGDEKRVQQILINLLGNAVKFTHRGEILLRIGYSGEIARFQVIDTGPGIPEDQLETIFLPFQRLSNGRSNAAPGSGLGLTLSKILTHLMGGELSVESTQDRGSTFSIRLFLPKLRIADDAIPEDEIVGYHGTRQKILVVDDQAEHRELLKSVLEPLGFVLREADSGEACLVRVQKEAFDLILLDIAMPGINGFHTVHQLRADGCKTPIVIVSANAYHGDRHQAGVAGADDFLAKPIRVTQLLHKLKLHLGIDWVLDAPPSPASHPSGAFHSPPEQSPPPVEAPWLRPDSKNLDALVACARIGDLKGLSGQLDRLVEADERHLSFANHLRSLIKEFRLGDIKQLLEEIP